MARAESPDRRRRHYLHAMGITLWASREARPPSRTGAAAPEATEAGFDPASPPEPERADLETLRRMVEVCTRCPLHQGRTHAVFGVGPQPAPFMVIGEGPGAQEDARGEPFVGRAGRLLNSMFFALGVPRDEVYIANIVKCRPPNNRDPRPEEVASCAAWLRRQIELVRPRAILAVGRVAAQNLLSSTLPLGRLRGVNHSYGSPPVPVVVTYHPAYLLRSPHEKGKAWQDLKRLRSLIEPGT